MNNYNSDKYYITNCQLTLVLVVYYSTFHPGLLEDHQLSIQANNQYIDNYYDSNVITVTIFLHACILQKTAKPPYTCNSTYMIFYQGLL